jgi:hypothetical protein
LALDFLIEFKMASWSPRVSAYKKPTR